MECSCTGTHFSGGRGTGDIEVSVAVRSCQNWEGEGEGKGERLTARCETVGRHTHPPGSCCGCLCTSADLCFLRSGKPRYPGDIVGGVFQ